MNTLAHFLFIIIFLNIVSSHHSVIAQRSEIGGSVGAMNYKGELSSGFNLLFYRPGATIFYRANINPTITFKYSLLYGNIYARDSKKKPFPSLRNESFSSQILELSALWEYNFFPFRDPKTMAIDRWTPYFFAGFAFFTDFNLYQPSIPFGVGLKSIYNKTWNWGFEFGARKTYTDRLDNLSGEDINNGIQKSNPYNKDWYFYTGLSISYTIYKVDCPEHLNPMPIY